jgi:hypothetical protein
MGQVPFAESPAGSHVRQGCVKHSYREAKNEPRRPTRSAVRMGFAPEMGKQPDY